VARSPLPHSSSTGRVADHRCYCKQQTLLYPPSPATRAQPTPVAGDHGAAPLPPTPYPASVIPGCAESLGTAACGAAPTTNNPSTISNQLSTSPFQTSLDRPTTSQSSLCCPEARREQLLVFWFSKLIQTCDHRNYSSPGQSSPGASVCWPAPSTKAPPTLFWISTEYSHPLDTFCIPRLPLEACENCAKPLLVDPCLVTSYRLVCLRTNLDHISYFTAAADSDKVGIRSVRADTFPRFSRRATFESEQHKALSVELCSAALSRSLLTFK
jgi:hypothetical protein